jgi:hypothetical protein
MAQFFPQTKISSGLDLINDWKSLFLSLPLVGESLCTALTSDKLCPLY